MWKNSKPKSSSYFSNCNGTIVARAVRGKPSEMKSYPPRVMPTNLPTRSPLPLRMVISDMARRRNPSPETVTNLSQSETFAPQDGHLQQSREMYSETQYGLSPDNFPSGRKNKYPFEKTRTPNVINDMRKKFNLMYGKPTDAKDESGEECTLINVANETSNPQKLKFTELYGKRPEFPPSNMISFAEFVRRVNKKSSIPTPQKRSWAEESFDGKVDDSESSSSSEVNCSSRNSQGSWKKRYLSTEMFLHSIQEEWPDDDDDEGEEEEESSVPISTGAPKNSPDDAMNIRKRKAGIFNNAFEISPEKRNRFAAPLPFEMFTDEGDSPGEESGTPQEDLNNDINKGTTVYPFYDDLLDACSQDSVYSDDSNDTKKTAFCLNNIQLYDTE